jgi:hypothetical protein
VKRYLVVCRKKFNRLKKAKGSWHDLKRQSLQNECRKNNIKFPQSVMWDRINSTPIVKMLMNLVNLPHL